MPRFETLPWVEHNGQEVIGPGGHISDRFYMSGTDGRAGVRVLKQYIAWFREQKERDASFSIDWVGQELVFDEFAFEEFNQTKMRPDDHAGGMMYSEREDTLRHQNVDAWLMRWRNYDIFKRFKITLLEWFDLPYPFAEWLLRRAMAEEERLQEEREKAEQERIANESNPNYKPSMPSKEDMAAVFGGGSEE